MNPANILFFNTVRSAYQDKFSVYKFLLTSLITGCRTLYLVLFTLLIIYQIPASAQKKIETVNISDAIGNKYFDALEYLERNTWIYDTLVASEIAPELAYSVVFPALTRYSSIKDIMETGAMRTLYVQSGRKYSRYSVGRFQMKPYFAEMVERNLVRYKIKSQTFNMSNTPKARSERAKRIDTPEWQVRYLIFYIKIMDKRFSHLKWKNPQDKVRFYATAFNVGFNKNERAIKYLMNKKSIIRKSKDFRSKLRDGDIAAWFFENDSHRFQSQISVLPKPTVEPVKE